MSTEHKRPLYAFVVVAVLCLLMLGHAVRSQALPGLPAVISEVTEELIGTGPLAAPRSVPEEPVPDQPLLDGAAEVLLHRGSATVRSGRTSTPDADAAGTTQRPEGAARPAVSLRERPRDVRRGAGPEAQVPAPAGPPVDPGPVPPLPANPPADPPATPPASPPASPPVPQPTGPERRDEVRPPQVPAEPQPPEHAKAHGLDKEPGQPAAPAPDEPQQGESQATPRGKALGHLRHP